MAVAPSTHLGEKRLLRLTQDLGLERQQVAKAGDAAELRCHDRTSAGEETSGPRPLSV